MLSFTKRCARFLGACCLIIHSRGSCALLFAASINQVLLPSISEDGTLNHTVSALVLFSNVDRLPTSLLFFLKVFFFFSMLILLTVHLMNSWFSHVEISTTLISLNSEIFRSVEHNASSGRLRKNIGMDSIYLISDTVKRIHLQCLTIQASTWKFGLLCICKVQLSEHLLCLPIGLSLSLSARARVWERA